MPGKYDDLLHLPHHVSKTHKPMSMEDRAAQFSPFAALTGYGAAVSEAGRLTDDAVELDENELAVLDRQLRALAQQVGQRPQVRITYFCPDSRKSGGTYVTAQGALKRIDLVERRLVLADGRTVSMDDVVRLEEPDSR